MLVSPTQNSRVEGNATAQHECFHIAVEYRLSRILTSGSLPVAALESTPLILEVLRVTYYYYSGVLEIPKDGTGAVAAG